MVDDLFEGFPEPKRKKRGPKVGSRQPENIIQGDIIKMLELKDWFVINMHGNEYQMGVPDLYACHNRYGTRWIEVKRKDKYRFTSAQIDVFPELAAKGVGVWILTAATTHEYNKLFKPANWHTFLEIMK